jgi:protein PET117
MQEKRAGFTLLSAIFASSFTIWFVHRQQVQEREIMYKGVLRDEERRLEKMRQREAELQESQRKREIYERFQQVRIDE